MKVFRVEPGSPLRGTIRVPSDKSITHRAILLAAAASGETRIRRPLLADDTLATLAAVEAMGVKVERKPEALVISSEGCLSEPSSVLDLGNSGTSIRLLAGLLSPQPFFSVLTGDQSLRSRPMGRVVEPLRRMGASIEGRRGGDLAPLAIRGGELSGIRHDLTIPSAQVKSALLIAGLFAEGITSVWEPARSRDHTERMLRRFGARLSEQDGLLSISGGARLSACEVEVPGDFSSAAFFLAAATLVEGSDLTIEGVGINPTRTGALDILLSMGGRIDLIKRTGSDSSDAEPVADLRVRYAPLCAVSFDGNLLLRAIDEFPILCVAAAAASGTTIISGAPELRVKESDRIKSMAEGLRAFGIGVQEREDGLAIEGGPMRGAAVKSFGDHRVAMALAVAGLIARGGPHRGGP